MEPHHVVPFGSPWWWGGWLIFAAYGAVVFWIGRTTPKPDRERFERMWGWVILGFFAFGQLVQVLDGTWSLQESLPLHLCWFSRFLAFLYLTFRQKWALVPLFFWGIVGGFHSLMTPESTLGGSSFMLMEYYFSHAGIILVPLYTVFVGGWRIPKNGWLHAFLWNNILLLPIYGIDLAVGGNYMYLVSKPQVDNPFVVGDWPYYILGFEAAALLHYGVLRLVFFNYIAPKTVPA
jgi:hypothetical integral membrane protein (TIGR02206 family)